MLTATKPFFESLDDWLSCIMRCDFDAAKSRAEYVKLAGQLLAVHPRFRQLMHARSPEVDPQTALYHMTDFLVCATELKGGAAGE